MDTASSGRSVAARFVPPAALVAVAAACVLFAMSAVPSTEAAAANAGENVFLTAPAWFTAAFAVLAALLLVIAGTDSFVHRAGGLLGLMASIGAALGGLLNLVGYANSDIWWAANPDAIRSSAAVLLITAIVAIVVVGSEQARPGWRRASS